MSASDQAGRTDGGRGPFDFFRFHGFWAPGVRLFRNLNFAAKALLVSLAFATPLAVLLHAYLSGVQATIAAARIERAG